MDKQNANNTNNQQSAGQELTQAGIAMARQRRKSRRDTGGIGPDGKPIRPIVITVVFVLLMLVAVYFGTVEGWFKGEVDPAAVNVTIPPDITPHPTYQSARPISTLDEKSLRVIALDVGQGSCTLMISPNGKTLLFGFGDEAHASSVAAELTAYGVKKLDVVFADSADEGHFGGFAQAAGAFSIGKLYAPEELLASGALAELEPELTSKGTSVYSVEPGKTKTVSWDKSCSVTLFSSRSDTQGEGGSCLVLRVEYNSASFLLAGSLKIGSEAALLASAGEGSLKSTVLFVAGSGAADCTGNELLAAVSPHHAVISVGSDGPAKETLTRLNARGIKLHRTDRSGAVIMTVDKNGLNII